MGDDLQQQGLPQGRVEDLQPRPRTNQPNPIKLLLQTIQGLQQQMQEMRDVQNIIRQEQQQHRQDLNPIQQQPPAPANDEAGENGQEQGDEDDEEIDATPKIARCLDILGFTHIKAMKIVEEGLANYDDFRSHTEKDIQGMIEAMEKRTIADGRCHLRLGEFKRLKLLLHWIQDYQRYSDEPDITKLNIEAIETAINRCNLRK